MFCGSSQIFMVRKGGKMAVLTVKVTDRALEAKPVEVCSLHLEKLCTRKVNACHLLNIWVCVSISKQSGMCHCNVI